MSDLTSLGSREEISWPIETGTIETSTIMMNYQSALDLIVSEATKECAGTGVRECWAISVPF